MRPFHFICSLRDHEQVYYLILLQSILMLPGRPLRKIELVSEYIPGMGKYGMESGRISPAWPLSRTGGHDRTYKAGENFRP